MWQSAASTLLFRFKVLKPDAAAGTQAFACRIDPTHEAWVMFEAVFEPVLFRFEADQHPGRFAMARDDDLLPLRLAKIARRRP